MAGATDVKEAAMLDAALDVTTYWLGLFKDTLPNDAGSGGVEVTGAGYGRIHISQNAPGNSDWAPAAGGGPTTKAGPKTGVTWTFNQPTADWGNIVGWGLWTAQTNGVLHFFGALTVPKTVLANEPAPVFNETHQIVVQLGDPGVDTF